MAEEATVLPPGVSQQGHVAPQTPPATPQQAAAPITPEPVIDEMDEPMEESGAGSGKWNYLEIGAGIILTTLFIFSVCYFRYKTTAYSAKLKKQDGKIASLQSEINSMQSQSQ